MTAIDAIASLRDLVRCSTTKRTWRNALISGLQAIPGVTVHGITDPAAFDRRVPTVAFTHVSKRPADIAVALGERNIFVWSGHNYALEPARALGIEEHGVVRVGPVHYNTLDEIDETLGAIEEIVS